MLEYFSYQKLKKHQAEKAARDAEATNASATITTTAKDSSFPSHTGDESPLATAASPSPDLHHQPTTTISYVPQAQTQTQPHSLAPTPPLEHAQQQYHHIPRKPLPVLTAEDEDFLRGFVGDADDALENRPPLPVRPHPGAEEGGNVLEGVREAGDVQGNEGQVVVHDGEGVKEKEKEKHGKKETYGEYAAGVVGGIKGRFVGKGKGKEKEKDHSGEASEEEKSKEKEKEKHEGGRFGFIGRTFSKKDKTTVVPPVVTPEEAANEKADLNKVLDDLNLSAVNNRAFSVSAESQAVLQKFTVILKDLVNGVPTAFDDLTHLLDDSQETLEKGYESLPSFLKKLVAQLPTKLTGGLAPELLAVASEAQGLSAAEAGAGFGAAAKNFLTPSSLKDLVTKPGAVVSLLKSIMNVLKLRWPAFMGTNVLFSLGLFILLFVFWYCHKRGREERLKRESAAQLVDSEGRIIELDDDPMLAPTTTDTAGQPSVAGPSGTAATTASASDRARSISRAGRQESTLHPEGASTGASRSRPTSASSWRSGRSLRRRKEDKVDKVDGDESVPVVKK